MLSGLVAVLWVALASPQDAACLGCHSDPSVVGGQGTHLLVDTRRHSASVHGTLECTTCHETIREYPHPEKPGTVQCVTCHESEVKDYETSVHATARGRGDVSAATCRSCHGPAHDVVPTSDPASPVSRLKIADTCGSCHANPDFLAQHKIPFAHPVEAFRLSVHGRALAAGNAKAASCSDCHGSHAVRSARDTASKINHWRVPETCGTCHQKIHDAYIGSVHGKAVAGGVPGAPVCTDCHGEHDILAPSEPGSLVNAARVSTVTCGRCHGDERLAARYNLPLDKLPAYEDSFHGLALRSGQLTVANCASCHGVHTILPSSDPQSSVNPANLAHTCGACHAGAGARFTIARVHVLPATTSEHAVVAAIRRFYWFVIPFALGLMLLHNGLDWWRKLLTGTDRTASSETLPRMNVHFRIAHALTIAGFVVLALTGFALKFPESWWAAPLLQWEGRHALRGVVHRGAAVVLLLGLAYHLGHLLASRRDRTILGFLIPSRRDVADVVAMTRHNLTGRTPRPTFGVFSYHEKVEYWAYMWGTAVMALSGFILWFNDASLAWFPKWVTDAATSLHYYEAILATAAIMVWHFYMVLFDPDVYPMEKHWLTGRVSGEHLKRTRPEYYARLKAGEERGDAPEE